MNINKRTRKVLNMVLAIIITFTTIMPFSTGTAQVPHAQETTQSETITQTSEQIALTTGGNLAGTRVEFAWGTDDRWPYSRWTLDLPSTGHVTVGSFRYDARFDGAVYEAWCIDPHLPGPEQTALHYYVLGSMPSIVPTARVAYPNNARITDSSYPHFYSPAFIAYMTRLAITIAARPGTTIVTDSDMTQTIYDLARGDGTWHNPAHFRPARYIQVNGVENAIASGETEGNMIVSDTFNLTNSHDFNPVTFRWQAGTPAGTQLIIGGNVVATAPALPTNNSFDGSVSFRLAVPQGADVNSARVEIVGIHDDYAEQAWYARTQVSPDGFQVIAFYIPRIRATAGFTYEYEVPPDGNGSTPTPDNSVRIQKICAITRENIPGALIRLRGMSSHQVVTGDGQLWEIDNTGINVSQVLTAGATTAVPGDVTSTVTDGVWTLEGLPWGFYMVEEERAPDGYSMYPQHTAYGFWHLPPNVIVDSPDGLTYNLVEADPNDNHILITFENYPFSEIVVYKREVSNGLGNNQLLAGATIRIQGYYPGNPAVPIDRVATTGSDGRVVFSDLPAGHYTVTEVQPPTSYLLGDNNVWTVNIGWGQTVAAGTASSHTFFNIPKSSLEVLKVCGETNEPLAGAVFELRDPTTGETWQATSDTNGIATFGIGNYGNYLYSDKTLILREVVAPSGFILRPESREVVLSPGNENRITIKNWQNPTLTIEKTDSVTGTAIQGAEFTIERLSPAPTGKITGNPFLTDAQGRIVLENLPAGVYRITETRAANNYWLDPQVANRTWTITTRENEDYLLQVENTLLPTLVITKMNAVTNRPIPLTHFRVEFEVPNSSNVQLIGNFVTNSNGQIILPFVQSGWYRITETRPAPGMALSTNNNYRVFLSPGQNTYQLMRQDLLPSEEEIPEITEDFTPPDIPEQHEELPQNNEADNDNVSQATNELVVTGGDDWLVGEGIWNFPLNSIVIKKSCSVTRQLLGGATFEVIHTSAGVSGTLGTVIGRYTTDPSGIIVITGLVPGSYLVREEIPPRNYTLSETNTQTVFLQSDAHSVVEVVFANDPLGGLLIVKRCEVTGRPLQNTEFRVTNSSGAVVGTANGVFRTNQQGEILIPNLPPDSYIVTEIRARDGFVLDSTPQTIRIEATGQIYRLEFTNTPIGGFQLLKLDEQTRRPIPNVEFAISRMNGEQIGVFTTDSNGIILVPNLGNGWFTAVERKAAQGYILDPTPHNFEIRDGQTATLTITNRRESGILLRKVCSVTGRGIYGVKFLISDENNNPIRTVVSDQNGHVFTTGLPDGKHFIREIEAAPGFIRDTQVKTFYLRYGSTTEIIWENTPMMGQIQITKRSADDNPINGFPVGTLLQGAVFEIFDRANNLVDTVETDRNGLAVSRLLPLGRYTIREARSPAYYIATQETFDAEIEFSGQIIRVTVLNKSVYTGVSVSKRGYAEVVPGQIIRYDFRNIANNSTVPLDSFFWRDTLPTSAVRLDRIVTGTWSARLSYRIVYRTNLSGDDHLVLMDNLSTAISRAIDASPTALGLAANEYVTEIMFVFGRVPAGFRQVEAPIIFCRVLPNLPHEHSFTNKTDVGGLHGDQWIMSNDRWVTTVFNGTPSKLPRTGF